MGNDFASDNQLDENIQVEYKNKLETPKMFKVLLHNDNYTTMEFVVEVLTKVFHMSANKATQVMLDVHKKGIGVCGVFSRDIAQTKVAQVLSMAKSQEYPLKCSYEEA